MLRATCLTLVLATLAPSVFAETATLDTKLVDQCLAGLEAREDKRVCVGRAARQCAHSADEGACLLAEIAYWETRMDAGFSLALNRAKGKDSDAQHLQLQARDQAAALQAAQDKWMEFRTATCAFEQTLWGAGTADAPEVQACHLYLTAEQVFYLEAVALIE